MTRRLTSSSSSFCKVCFHIKPVSVTSFYATTTVKEKPGSVHLFLLFLLSKTQKSRNSQLTKLQVKVLPTHDTSKVRASGSGLNTTGAPTSLPVKVTIDAKDAGPRGEAQEADICDSHDGTYLVFYVPDMTDRYTTLIKYGGDKIPY
ncbi:filamin-A-like [Haplochromis burtoni]|uniref:filamin-A-like n=1 Tax=Haplochromis burtoni TaxID=8153 RepID=UPI001C2DE2FE|nr:filamin-A-like [Haplochromis burtoni]